MTAHEAFKKEFGNSTNFMTPKIVKRGILCKSIAYEISSGTGLNHNPIYAVTLVKILPDGRTKRFDPSPGIIGDTRGQAETWIENAKRNKDGWETKTP